ncbi:glycosyltransferase N-terminal domain-containing protein [Cognatiyoonia sp. IB215446]|uniref:3-deoxy-D-manno-octulosonic acid transferase n=1 Tax=Cognatiyoonia sp. IB215446 TaxID=3097355 RepID=UPI002A0FD524|nr:glycosyltransferase N-terminal domain-containing protein [Cognatiyoonia sp. IB215446]MDX8347314.1 glycosyltransferase N-terminal domain-containing protein [Cognatiyoonia sp. IB215446]
MNTPFPSLKLRVALIGYAALWWAMMPVILLYLWRRGRKDPLYSKHISERFGWYRQTLQQPVWVHAVSLGEMRSATPLIRALLDRGETVLTTHFTPAGRREAERAFAEEIAAGQVQTVWVPFEYGFSYRRFLRHFAPKYGLIMEIEIWPRMIAACHRLGTPLFMCNAQYPKKSYEKDTQGLGLRAELLAGFAGGFVKSEGQRARFASLNMPNLYVTGELRFDQPIPQAHLDAAAHVRQRLTRGRPTFTLTSVVEGEDSIYLRMIKATPEAFFVYVPRAPERFDEVAEMLSAAGIRYARRSELFDDTLAPRGDTTEIDVLLGDSMGEMYFYLALCGRAIVGGGFVTKGAHNVIEPLALKKPVIVGPHIWTIEYPATEAIAAGVCAHVMTKEGLISTVQNPPPVSSDQITAFYDAHAGGAQRTIAAIEKALPR